MDGQRDTEEAWHGLERRRDSACQEAQRLATSLVERVAKLERSVEQYSTAFVKNDLGQPDLDGHRRAHSELVKAAETMDEYKAEGAKNIIRLAATFFAGVLSIGVVDWIKSLK